jgi:hypothetical protein
LRAFFTPLAFTGQVDEMNSLAGTSKACYAPFTHAAIGHQHPAGLGTRKVGKNVNDLAILAKRRKKHALIRHASDSSLCIEQSSKCKGKESNAMESPYAC